MAQGTRRSTAERFWEKVDVAGPGGCWLWTGGLCGGGYGRFAGPRGRGVRAHRFAYEDMIGPVPEGLQLDHLCRVRACVNPAHLEPVTAAENIRRGEGIAARNSRKTHCAKGHPLAGENLYVYRGKRECVECHRERGRLHQKRRRANLAVYNRKEK